MVKKTLQLLVLPVATALVAAGCCSHSPKMASAAPPTWTAEAQGGAPAVEQGTAITTGMGTPQTVSQADIELRKEELVVGKREISNGGVLVRRVVQTENVSQPVELKREEYVIERIPASDAKAMEAANQAGTAFQPQEFYIPLTREEPVATKRIVAVENVHLDKQIETDHETITRPVRWEDVQVTKVAGKAPETQWQETSAPTSANAASAADSFQLAREEMVVGKRDADNGGVTLRKIVYTKDASQPIDLTRQEYTLTRTPISGQELAPTTDFSPMEIRMDLTRQEAVASTQVQPTEWVRLRKQTQTDNQIVTGTVRKDDIEVVKLAANQPGMSMGGTSAIGDSGATVMSESGSPKQMTLSGTAVCAKCQLHQTAECQNALQVKNGDTTTTYYLVQNDVSKDFHKNACKEGKQVTVTGTVQDVGGKLELTPTKIDIQ